MAGLLLRVLPKRVFDFASIATGSTQVVWVVERIDISQHIDCMIALRVHSATLAGGNTITFDLLGDAYTSEDPGTIFRTASPLFTATAVSASGTQLLTYGGTVRGHYAALRASANKTVGGAINATVSMDLVLRTPDES